MHGFDAQFCEVRVDADLGTIRVTRYVGAFALGNQLNVKTLRGQLQGGVVWGIGMALQKESLMDPFLGRFVNTNLAEYHVPVKRRRRVGITGAAAAIGNAVYHATGRRVRELPITLDKLL
jgi:xanthine dehydrogenase YagR molybdenum-binding subunit